MNQACRKHQDPGRLNALAMAVINLPSRFAFSELYRGQEDTPGC